MNCPLSELSRWPAERKGYEHVQLTVHVTAGHHCTDTDDSCAKYCQAQMMKSLHLPGQTGDSEIISILGCSLNH